MESEALAWTKVVMTKLGLRPGCLRTSFLSPGRAQGPYLRIATIGIGLQSPLA
jgi:hypothetical protein